MVYGPEMMIISLKGLLILLPSIEPHGLKLMLSCVLYYGTLLTPNYYLYFSLVKPAAKSGQKPRRCILMTYNAFTKLFLILFIYNKINRIWLIILDRLRH